jgi:hypothetical protein
MRRFALIGTIALALAVVAPAGATHTSLQRHVHSITSPGGTTDFGGGVSNNAPCVAFLNLHFNVHIGVFVQGDNPNQLGVDFIDNQFCPLPH